MRSRISFAEKARPLAWVMGKVRVASDTNQTSNPRSEACRVVVSQHCSVRMPLTRSRPMPRATT